jgi:hypothetical protein
MGVLVLIVIVGLIVGGVWLNHRTSKAAMQGVLVKATVPPERVISALAEIYCSGSKAAFRSVTSGVSVKRTSGSTFSYQTKNGDCGTIKVTPDGSGALVVASTDSLFVGSTFGRKLRSPIWPGVEPIKNPAPSAVQGSTPEIPATRADLTASAPQRPTANGDATPVLSGPPMTAQDGVPSVAAPSLVDEVLVAGERSAPLEADDSDGDSLWD